MALWHVQCCCLTWQRKPSGSHRRSAQGQGGSYCIPPPFLESVIAAANQAPSSCPAPGGDAHLKFLARWYGQALAERQTQGQIIFHCKSNKFIYSSDFHLRKGQDPGWLSDLSQPERRWVLLPPARPNCCAGADLGWAGSDPSCTAVRRTQTLVPREGQVKMISLIAGVRKGNPKLTVFEVVQINTLLTSPLCEDETKGREDDSGTWGLTNLLHKWPKNATI